MNGKTGLVDTNAEIRWITIKKNVSVADFVHKDLIHFSNSDNIRSIPYVVDGLKPQRKVLFGCFKRNLVKEIRVAQLAGYISEHCAYHHGEVIFSPIL